MTMTVDAHRPAPFTRGGQVYVRAPKPVEFPSEGGPEEDVPESKRHLNGRTALYLLLREAYSTTTSIGSDQFVYWDATDPGKRLAPDVFVKTGRPDDEFDTWKVWEHGAPDMAVEIVSPADRSERTWEEKLGRYMASGIREVVRFDRMADQPLRIWDRVDDDLVERSDKSPNFLRCEALGLYWVVVPAPIVLTLRLARDPEGKDLLATPDEERQHFAEEAAEARRARAEAEHARMVAEQARAAEASARAAAETENDRLRAEIERLVRERSR